MYTMANVLKHLLVLMLINLISDVKTGEYIFNYNFFIYELFAIRTSLWNIQWFPLIYVGVSRVVCVKIIL